MINSYFFLFSEWLCSFENKQFAWLWNWFVNDIWKGQSSFMGSQTTHLFESLQYRDYYNVLMAHIESNKQSFYSTMSVHSDTKKAWNLQWYSGGILKNDIV